jgi:hypothetical protein
LKRLLAAAASLVLVAAAGQAAAHARLIVGTPKAGSTVAAPRQLRLQYSESIVPAASSVTVAGPGGAAVATGPLTIDAANKRMVTVPFTGKLGSGAYHVHWEMKTEDGHQTFGDFTFSVKP